MTGGEQKIKKRGKKRELFSGENQYFSGMRMMWMIVMFDLPTNTKKQRKAATKFRDFLLDCGFSMTQYSVYIRLLSGKERARTLERKIGAHVPKEGSIQILCITDKQYENIKSYHGHSMVNNAMPDQLQLF